MRAGADTTASPPTADVVIDAVQTATPPTRPSSVKVTFRTAAPGHLFLPGQPVDLAAVITSDGKEQPATVSMLVTSGTGCEVFRAETKVTLPAQGDVTVPVTFEGANHLPNGPYRVEVCVIGEWNYGYGFTGFSIWDGPLPVRNNRFGISYQGPLMTERTWQDLDFFKMAGVGWVRFPLHGWLPQGQTSPAEAEQYNTFVQEAGKRDFSLLAAFTPSTTVDPAVNAVQADKEYRESLLAAATRYSFKVKHWELLTVKSDPQYKEFRGIRYPELASGRSALREFDKSLSATFTVDAPFKWNSLELFNLSLPARDDTLGMRYNFNAIPEYRGDSSSPIYAREDVLSGAKDKLKKTPALWVTEYGFDATKGDRLPDANMQAALLSRALILNRAQGIERVFWRHDPSARYDLPFTGDDGNVQPNLLALRTTLRYLEGVTRVAEVPSPPMISETSPRKLWVFLLCYEGEKGKKKTKPRYVLVAWSELRESKSAALAIKTSAMTVKVVDLWGNALELQPTSRVAMFPVDAMPHFVELGTYKDVEAFSPFVRFTPSRILLHEGGDTHLELEVRNDQRLFAGKVSCEVRTRRWPGESEVKTQKVDLGPADKISLVSTLSVPAEGIKGQLYDINAEIFIGSRRVGYLTLPVFYQPPSGNEEKPATP